MKNPNSNRTDAPCRVRKYPKNWKWGLIFIAPWFIGFALLQAYPLLMSLYYSFTDFSILKAGKWIGLKKL